MKRMPLRILAMSVSALSLVCCSVKEYREACPCRLVLDLSEVDTAVVRSADLYVSVPGGYVSTDVIGKEHIGYEYVTTVPRTELVLNLSSGSGGMMSDKGLDIPLGNECPPVYMHTSVIDGDCEVWHEKVRMRKNYCRVHMSLEGQENSGVSLAVKGNIAGYDAYGSPESGDFLCRSMLADPSDVCVISVPRQTDDSLVLEVDDGSGICKVFTLGIYISSAGYDWTSPDLKDISVVLDFAISHVTLKVHGWEEEHVFDVVI